MIKIDRLLETRRVERERRELRDFLTNALDEAMDEASTRWGHDPAGEALLEIATEIVEGDQ